MNTNVELTDDVCRLLERRVPSHLCVVPVYNPSTRVCVQRSAQICAEHFVRTQHPAWVVEQRVQRDEGDAEQRSERLARRCLSAMHRNQGHSSARARERTLPVPTTGDISLRPKSLKTTPGRTTVSDEVHAITSVGVSEQRGNPYHANACHFFSATRDS